MNSLMKPRLCRRSDLCVADTHPPAPGRLALTPPPMRAADNMLYRYLLALALLASGADAYMLAPLRPVRAPMRAAVTLMGVNEAVADCLESGCSIDDVSTLIGELKSAHCRGSNSAQDYSALRKRPIAKILSWTPLPPSATQRSRRRRRTARWTRRAPSA